MDFLVLHVALEGVICMFLGAHNSLIMIPSVPFIASYRYSMHTQEKRNDSFHCCLFAGSPLRMMSMFYVQLKLMLMESSQ